MTTDGEHLVYAVQDQGNMYICNNAWLIYGPENGYHNKCASRMSFHKTGIIKGTVVTSIFFIAIYFILIKPKMQSKKKKKTEDKSKENII